MYVWYDAGDFWNHMVNATQNSTVSYSVVINPNSGPGDAAEEVYTTGIDDLINAGVEVGVCVDASNLFADRLSLTTPSTSE